MAFKMKGSPMHRNYGVGTPTKKVTGEDPPEMTEEQIKAAEANAMGAANVQTLSDETRGMASKLQGMTPGEVAKYETRLRNNTGDPAVRSELALFNKAKKVSVK
jgi:hypothetical protein